MPIQNTPILLGDRIESALSGIGITKERVSAFLEKHGLPSDCGCTERQEALNHADQWMREVASTFGEKAAEAIATFWAPVSWLKQRASQSGNPPPRDPKI